MPRRTLGRKVGAEHDKLLSVIKERLEQVQPICTTADVWSCGHRSFMGATAHWIDPCSLQRKPCVLACRRSRGEHTYDRIAELLICINEDFRIDDKVVVTVTDNGSNLSTRQWPGGGYTPPPQRTFLNRAGPGEGV